MKKVCFPQWDEEDKVTNEINCVTAQIKSVKNKLPTNDITYGDYNFRIFKDNVRQTLGFWTGRTYVGYKKGKAVQKAFQAFFEALYNFLLFCQKENNSFNHALKDFADRTLYQGKVYRYIGHCAEDNDFESKVEPEFNNIYVSWSKKPDNNYIQNKLYGTKTLITCVIVEPYYGIDLDVFGVVRADETEVVFPTVREMITGIKYLE